jgi:hypothetical protein
MTVRSGLTIVLFLSAAGRAQVLPQTQKASRVPSTTLSGKVTDLVLGTPLPSAGIAIRGENLKLVKAIITDDDGTYAITGLVSGRTYWATYCSDGYSPALVSFSLPANGDRQLTKTKANKLYWQKTALIKFSGKEGQVASRNDFDNAWSNLETSPISASGKAHVAHEVRDQLKGKPEVWNTNELFKAYADADPNRLDKAEASIWANRPDDVSGLNSSIVHDIRSSKAKFQPMMDVEKFPADPCNPK